MAYTNTARTGNATLIERLGLSVRSVGAAVERRRLYNTTLRELSALTERELADLGLHRTTIADIAREAAYGK